MRNSTFFGPDLERALREQEASARRALTFEHDASMALGADSARAWRELSPEENETAAAEATAIPPAGLEVPFEGGFEGIFAFQREQVARLFEELPVSGSPRSMPLDAGARPYHEDVARECRDCKTDIHSEANRVCAQYGLALVGVEVSCQPSEGVCTHCEVLWEALPRGHAGEAV